MLVRKLLRFLPIDKGRSVKRVVPHPAALKLIAYQPTTLLVYRGRVGRAGLKSYRTKLNSNNGGRWTGLFCLLDYYKTDAAALFSKKEGAVR